MIIWVFNRDLSDHNDEEEKQSGIMLFAQCFSHDGVMVAGHEGSFWDWRKTIVATVDFGTAFLKRRSKIREMSLFLLAFFP